MKIKYLLLLLTINLPTWAMSQVPNGDLENWSGGLPVGWTITQAPGYIYVLQSSNAQSGNSAIRFQVVTDPNGTACNPLSGPASPVSGIPISLTFWYQLTVTGGDSLWLQAGVYQPGLGTSIGGINKRNFPPVTTWTPISVPFTYFVNPGNSDTIAFTFQLQNFLSTQLDGGTFALLDNFSVDVLTETQEPSPTFLKTSSYPNPASDEIHIAFVAPSPGDAVIQIMDVTGRVLIERTTKAGHAGWTTERLDTHALAAGNYLAQVRMGERVAHLQVAITH